MTDRSLMAMLEPMRRRILMTIGRAVVRAVDDSAGRQCVQAELMKGELRDAIERMQNYGFTSVPFSGSDAAVIFIGGDRANGIAVVVDDRRYRLTSLSEGEVAIYDDQGQKVHLTRSGIIIDGGGLPITITNTSLTTIESDVTIDGSVTASGSVTVTGNVASSGNITATGNVTASGNVSDSLGSMVEIRTVYNSHKHTTSGPTPIQQMT